MHIITCTQEPCPSHPTPYPGNTVEVVRTIRIRDLSSPKHLPGISWNGRWGLAHIIRRVNNNNPAVLINTTAPQSTKCRMEATELEQLNEYIKGKRLDVVDEVRCRLGHWAIVVR